MTPLIGTPWTARRLGGHICNRCAHTQHVRSGAQCVCVSLCAQSCLLCQLLSAACAWCAGAAKSVRIDQWKVSTIHEFLQGKLDLSKSKKKAQTATS